MGQRFAVYQLKKVSGKKEYIVSSYTVWNSLKQAYHDLECWHEDLDESGVYYMLDDRMLFAPNIKDVLEGDYYVEKIIGAYGWYPIYFIDVYKNPYSYYKLHKKRGRDELYLEGVK